MYPSAASPWRSGGGLDLFERGMEKKRAQYVASYFRKACEELQKALKKSDYLVTPKEHSISQLVYAEISSKTVNLFELQNDKAA